MKKIYLIAPLFIISTASALAQTAPTPTPQPIRAAAFGLQTLETGRTARLNVVHSAPLTSVSPNAVPVRYAVRADFDVYMVRSDGSLRILRRVSREAMLAEGEGLTFDYASSSSDGNVRVSPSVYIQRVGETERTDTAPSVSVSLEVRMQQGTLFLLPGTIRGFNPQPDPPRELIIGNRFD